MVRAGNKQQYVGIWHRNKGKVTTRWTDHMVSVDSSQEGNE